MELSETASRFDNSISWLAEIGNEAALSVFDLYGLETVFARNAELAARLRDALSDIGRPVLELANLNRSTIVAVPFEGADPQPLLAGLKERGITCSARDGNLRLAVHFYNHEDDIERLTGALVEIGRSR
jgi:selenocysteine lyase/cysteine desulfurase